MPFDPETVLPWDPEAPAYAGAGIHGAILFKDGPFFKAATKDDDEPQLPNEWWAAETELVVCEYVDESYEGKKLDTCEYTEVGGDGSITDRVSVYSARYIYRVFEAKTGRLVKEFALNSSVSPLLSCPTGSSLPITPVYQFVSSEDLVEKLRPLVEGTAPGQ